MKNFYKLFGALVLVFILLSMIATPNQPVDAASLSVLTNRYNIGRTGANLNETILNTYDVNPHQFGRLFTRAVVGDIYAMPLYVPGLNIPNVPYRGVHNVVFVATMHNNVYAFDADDPTMSAPLWQVNLGPPFTENVKPQDIWNLEIGILSTPVIDPITNTLYLVTQNCDSYNPSDPNPDVHCTHDTVNPSFHRLHALDITTGAEKFNGPVTITATSPASGPAYVLPGTISFDSWVQLQRPGLLLLNGVVYIAFGANADLGDYHGWIMGYSASNLQQQLVFNVTPHDTGISATDDPNFNDVQAGGIWQSGTGLSSDGTSIYAVTGNGTFNVDSCNPPAIYCNYGSSIIRLNTSLQVQDYFTPSDFQRLNDLDLDLGIDAAIFVPGTNYVITGSKEGILYVVNRASMGHINRAAFPDDPQIVQEFCFVGPQLSDCRTASPSQHMHSAPIFWNGPDGLTLYLWSEWDVAKAYHFNTGTGLFDTTPVSQGTVATNGMPSGILSLSANGSTLGTGIVWGTHTPLPSGDRHGVLQAFDASDLSHILWDSDANPADGVGTVAKFTPPMVVNGKVYMASFNNRLDVYGLLYPYSTLPIRNYRTTKPITLSWNWVDWAAFYEIQVDDNADFGSPLSSVTSPLPASRLSTNVSPGYGTYYWHVRAKRADGYTGPWSATETFTLGR